MATGGRKQQPFQRRAPRQARSRATVDSVLEAAARIIREQGPAALTTNRISEVAGVGIATLYGYFPHKTAVMVALARRLMAEDEAAILAAAASAAPGQAVRGAIRAVLERHSQDTILRRAVMSVHHGQGLAAEHTGAAQRAIGRLLSEGPTSRPTPPDPLRLFVLTRAVLGVARALVEESPPASIAGLENELVRLAEFTLGDVIPG
jgi:AcrR family transcriptional regulator